jgi:branched-chain amino acid transport system permease protein
VPEIAPGPAYALQQLVAGLPKIATFGLLAAAYALVFGLVGRINLAFGEIAAVGAAATTSGVALMGSLGLPDPIAGIGLGLVLALFAAGLHGLVGARLTVGGTRGGQAALIATIGLSVALMEYLRLVRGPVEAWVPPILNETWPLARAGSFVVTVTPVGLAASMVGLLAAALLLWLVAATAFGRAWRAYADDPTAAAMVGVDGGRLLNRTLALASALAGLAGFLVVVQYGSLGYADGFQLGLKALVGAVLGGIGSVPGALLGGLAIGIFEVAWSALLPIEGRDIAVYAALIAFLVFRPGGLLGWRDGRPRQV